MIKIFKDQLGREISVKVPVQRIVSLVPSQTEFLFDLRAGDKVAGVTKFCEEPFHLIKNKVKVGGTKNVNVSKVLSLKPDLVLANKEENIKKEIDELAESVPVWVSDVNDFSSAWDMMTQIGEMTGKQENAAKIIDRIKASFKDLYFAKKYNVIYLIWKEPYMVAGGDTFIHFMLQKCGFINLFDSLVRYPVIALDEIQELKPDLILLSSEPYPFAEKHVSEFQQLSPSANVLLVDGKMFSWYGSRLQYAADYFRKMRGAIF